MARRKRWLSMRKIREIFRLSLSCGMGNREVARSCGISHTVVNKYLKRAKEASLGYREIEAMDEEQLKRLLQDNVKPPVLRALPDWEWVHRELKRDGVTLQLLWEEYRESNPDGYQPTQFSKYYKLWRGKLELSLRQTHKAGEKMFVDYAGHKVPVIDRLTGEVRDAEIFVAVLGTSNYTFAEATWDQSLPSWIGSHVKALEYFGGVPRILIPDNLKSGVTKACRYEPDLNPTYQDLALHYGTAIIPARVRRPKDKAKVEVGVQMVERWILAALRNRTFFSLAELNEAIRELLVKLNQRPFKKLKGSRASWFEAFEKGALKLLPETRYVFAEWKKARVNIDYHVEFKGHYYSVPYALVREEVELRCTAGTVEVFYKGKRVASHQRNDRPGQHTTQKEHMPKSHREYLEWKPTRLINWARKIGESTAMVVEAIINTRSLPEQGYRSCLGLLRLAKVYSEERLERACKRAVAIRGCSYKSVKSILEKGLDKEPLPEVSSTQPIEHDNIRGCRYYH